MAQAQADADFGIAGAIAGATAGKAGAAAGSIYSAAVSKAAGDLTRALNAVQTGFVDAATAASVKATKTIAAAETVERKAVAKADVVLAQDLQTAWGTYAAAERSAVTLNARERATIGADSKKEVARAELAAVKAVAPARKTSMVAAAEANGVYHVKVTRIIADLGILGGEIKVEQVKASHSLISPATLKKWLDSLATWGDMSVAAIKGLAQGVANLGNAAQDVGVGLLNVPAASVNFGSWASENLFFAVPEHMKIRLPYIPSPDWSKGMVTQESDFDHGVSKTAAAIAVSSLSMAGSGRWNGMAGVADDVAGAGQALLTPVKRLPAPAPSARLLQLDLDHIVARHGPTSGASGAGKFASETTGKSLVDMIKEGVGKGIARPNTRNRPGTIYDYDFGYQIGVDIAGNVATRIRVIVRLDRTVVTAFPF